MPGLGFGKHGSDEPLQQVDRLIGQSSAELKGDRNQGCVAALPLIAGDMLGRRPPGFASKLGEACLMHAMPARGIDADRPDMVQALDQAEHRGWLCRLRQLAQPAEPALPGLRPALSQRIQLPPLLRERPSVSRRSISRRARKRRSIQRRSRRRGRRNDDPPPAAFLHDQLGKMEKAVVLTGVRMKGVGEFRRGVFPKGAQPKPLLAFSGMPSAVLLRREIAIDRRRRSINLFRDKGRQLLPAAAHRLAAADRDSANSTASVRNRGGCDRPDTDERSRDHRRTTYSGG